jgi:hypothetical protein
MTRRIRIFRSFLKTEDVECRLVIDSWDCLEVELAVLHLWTCESKP